MTHNELLLAAGVVLGAGCLALAGLLRLRRRKGLGEAERPRDGSLRRTARRIRQLERIARRTEERLNSRMDELRRLLAQAERVIARVQAPPGEAPPPDTDVAAPGLLEKQRDHVLRLRLQGLETIDIARRLGLPVGEVELTLKLQEKEKDLAGAPRTR